MPDQVGYVEPSGAGGSITQVGYQGDPDFVAAANGLTPMPEGYSGVGVDSLPSLEEPVLGKKQREGRVRSPKRS